MKLHEEGTGAIRSADLAIERWDLISGSALELLPQQMNLGQYDYMPKTLVDQAVSYLYRFLGNVSGCNDSRLDWVLSGWGCLATAIQLLDMSIDELAALRSFLTESKDETHYPYYAIKRLSETCHEGASKYGEHNWLHGFHVAGLANHGIRHMVKWTNGDRTEDHLGHTMWSFMTITHMFLFRPDMCTLLLGVDYTLTDEIVAKFPFKKREPMDVDRKLTAV